MVVKPGRRNLMRNIDRVFEKRVLRITFGQRRD
jgi:hypothetical protein